MTPQQDFTNRTDSLASTLQSNLAETAAYIGISRATLYALRNGERPISPRGWRKLKLAEERASTGDGAPPAPPPEVTWAEVYAFVNTLKIVAPHVRAQDVLNVLLRNFPLTLESKENPS